MKGRAVVFLWHHGRGLITKNSFAARLNCFFLQIIFVLLPRVNDIFFNHFLLFLTMIPIPFSKHGGKTEGWVCVAIRPLTPCHLDHCLSITMITLPKFRPNNAMHDHLFAHVLVTDYTRRKTMSANGVTFLQ